MKKPLLKNSPLPVLILSAILFAAGCSKTATSTGSNAVIGVVITNGLIANLTTTSAQSGGIITSNGNTDLLGQGVCYSSSNQTPTVGDTKTTDTYAVDAAGTESFTSNITGLTAGTTYYLRAYVTNTAGTAYGSVLKFTTSATINSVTATVSTLAGSISGGFLDATGTNALFTNPQAVATDAAGNVYVADSFNERIREITPVGVTTTFAGDGNAGLTNGAATVARFYGPQGIAHDAQGNFYVADIGNSVIRKITAAGVVSTFAGNGTAGYVDGAANVAEFNNPQSVAVDASGNVYVADRNNNRIRKITPAGVVSTFAGTGYAGDTDGVGTTVASFNAPKAVAVDASGNVYVADPVNYAIRKITSAGVVSTFAGGIVQTTLIGAPAGLAIDASGNLFITDQDGRILEITTQNILYVLAGSNSAGYVDGVGANAKFNSPQGITVDSKSNIYVADYNNNVIRKITVDIE